MTPEGRIKAMVKRDFSRFKMLYEFMPVQRGMGPPGLDFFFCICGVFVAVETKLPGKKLSPRQIVTANAIAAAGGVVYVIRDAYDSDRAIISIGRKEHGLIYDQLGSYETHDGDYWCP